MWLRLLPIMDLIVVMTVIAVMTVEGVHGRLLHIIVASSADHTEPRFTDLRDILLFFL